MRLNADQVMGLICVVLSLLTIFLWLPLDSGSGLTVQMRGRSLIGDAMAPTGAAVLLGLSGLLLIVTARHTQSEPTRLTGANLVFLLILIIVLAVAITLMRWTGPLAVTLIASDTSEYRLLRDTLPWKYLGYLLGGSFLVTTLICWIERRVSTRAVLVGFLIALALALAYDLPFDDLLLPPNGDV